MLLKSAKITALIMVIVFVVNSSVFAATNKGYNRQKAASYAKKYAKKRNKKYKYYGGKGGDCTNFVSQCLRAGGMKDKRAFPTSRNNPKYWYYAGDFSGGVSLSWVNAHTFRKHWGTVGKKGYKRAYKMKLYKSPSSVIKHWSSIYRYNWKGDIVQLRNSNGSTFHSMIIYEYTYNKKYKKNDFYIAQHSSSPNLKVSLYSKIKYYKKYNSKIKFAFFRIKK